jgi:hypothetical protein
MPADAANQNVAPQTEAAAAAPVAKEAPTEQQQSQPGIPKKITNAQTVCNEKNAKGKLCNGHLKQMKTGGEESEKHLRGDDVLFQCQTCGTLYMGPPLGHVRDPEKQSRFVEKELMGILRAAGGTLPAFKKSERGTLVPLEEDASHHAPAPAASAAKPAAPAAAAATKTATPAGAKPATAASAAAPANETPEERKARLIAEAQARKAAGGIAASPAATAAGKPSAAPAASTSGTDSSPEADRHRPAAEAQAATGQASAAPMSSAASTASPAAGAETPSDLAPEASTELTPGAPRDERQASAPQSSDSKSGVEDNKTSEG